MKNLLILLLALPLMAMTQGSLQQITSALGKGNAEALGPFFDSSVEISILDDVDIYDKSEAVSTVKSFFATNAPKGYSQVHEGTSKGKDSRYVIGKLTTTTGAYRVFLYLKSEGDKEIIQELRFDKE